MCYSSADNTRVKKIATHIGHISNYYSSTNKTTSQAYQFGIKLKAQFIINTFIQELFI